ncbi:MAG: polysaccharide biosynthesis protein, partial [Gammaproteobacteria bacterium]
VLSQSIINYSLGIHRGSWRFCSMLDAVKIIKSAMIGLIAAVIVVLLISRIYIIPRSIPFIYSLLLIMFLGAPRFLYRILHEYTQTATIQKRVLVIGAGSSGEALVRDLHRNKSTGFFPVAFVDDSANKIGREIHTLKVYGDLSTIPVLCKQLNIALIIIAMPTASSQQMQRVVALCEAASLPFRIVPSITDLASGRVALDSLRSVSLEDLLGREEVKLDWQNIAACVQDKVVLVTGGAGSIGSELCRQIARFSPEKLLIVDNCEFNLYSLDMELAQKKGLAYVPVLLDVTDRDGVRELMRKYRPHIVFHAAAYKHVPLLENQLRCAMSNNILGTQVLAEEAATSNVAKFVMVSTDKAVRPTNIMGATKRIAEIVCQNFNRISNTQFITVRFGNVLGSAGSVVPLFKKQLQQGGPITVTHPDVSRYFMT